MAETGDIPKEITDRISKPLQKTNKAKDSPSNMRPIIFLSSLSKILTACIIIRIKDRIDAEIPSSQVANRPNGSTTEHIIPSKLIIGRTITERNKSVHLIMLDMSKELNCININKLIEDLRNTIETDVLHIISKLMS